MEGNLITVISVQTPASLTVVPVHASDSPTEQLSAFLLERMPIINVNLFIVTRITHTMNVTEACLLSLDVHESAATMKPLQEVSVLSPTLYI